MGQKIVPISLRLKNKKNWHSQWIIEKKDYSKTSQLKNHNIKLLNIFFVIFLNIFKEKLFFHFPFAKNPLNVYLSKSYLV